MPTESEDRKRRSHETIDRYGLTPFAGLPLVEESKDTTLRANDEVVDRCFALAAVAVRGSSIGEGNPLAISEIRQKLPGAFNGLSPWEAEFMRERRLPFFRKPPDHQSVVDASWRYEALNALLWHLGLIQELHFPDVICDARLVTQTTLQLHHHDLLPAPRPINDVLDALDLHYRLHWIVVEAQLKKVTDLKGVNPSVVRERHYALNWLTRYMDQDWDNVTTDT